MLLFRPWVFACMMTFVLAQGDNETMMKVLQLLVQGKYKEIASLFALDVSGKMEDSLASKFLKSLSIPTEFGMMAQQTQSYMWAIDLIMGYGCWCGFGNHGNPLARTVDSLDACCKAHDLDYGFAKKHFVYITQEFVNKEIIPKMFRDPTRKIDPVVIHAALSIKYILKKKENRAYAKLVKENYQKCSGGKIPYKFQLDPKNKTHIECLDHPKSCAGFLCRADRKAALCFHGKYKNPDFLIPPLHLFPSLGTQKGFDRSKNCHPRWYPNKKG